MREDVETRHRRRDGHEVGLKTHTVFLSLAASPVVIPRLEDDEVIAVDEVYQPVLARYASRPGPGEGMAERLGLADAFKRVTGSIARILLMRGSMRRSAVSQDV